MGKARHMEDPIAAFAVEQQGLHDRMDWLEGELQRGADNWVNGLRELWERVEEVNSAMVEDHSLITQRLVRLEEISDSPSGANRDCVGRESVMLEPPPELHIALHRSRSLHHLSTPSLTMLAN